jgi:hypothetical protein
MLVIAVVLSAGAERAALAAPALRERPEPPCAACVIFVVDDVLAQELPGPLNGLEVLVRVAAEPHELAPPLQAIRAVGGRPGILLPLSEVSALDVGVLTAASRVVVGLPEARGIDESLLFRLRTVLSDVRGAAPEAALGVAAARPVVPELLAHGLAPYVDFIAMLDEEPLLPALFAGADARLIGRVLLVDGGEIQLPAAGTAMLVAPPPGAAGARRVVHDIARAAPWLGEGLVAEGIWEVSCHGRPQPTYLDAATLDTLALVHGCAADDIAVEAGAGQAARVTLSTGLVIVRVPAPDGVFTDRVQVRADRTLTVREIVARHQAAAARQRRAIETLVSSGAMTLTFEAPGFPAPMTITSDTVLFVEADRVEVEQRDIRVNGIAFREGGVPRLPLIEPERVASPPLAITLTDMYRYSLAGEEIVDGVACYVVGFEPLDRRVPLFAGRAWIAKDSFALVRVAAVQTGLRGPIVSSEQIETYREEREGIWLLARSEVRQLYEGAGHRTPVHRVLTVRQHEINPPAFGERRRQAYASPSVMLRDTADGFRYLRRERDASPDRVPEVHGAASSVRTLALGAIFDPNIDRPLPFAGVSYVHFDLFGRGGQLNGFFGGTYGQLALSLPSLGGTRWQAGARAFGIASAYNDRAFVAGREMYEANISQRPAHASAWLLRPVGDRLALRVGYALDYTHFGRSGTTAPTFRIPAAQVSHGATLALHGQRAGLDGSAWWTGALRTGWRAWGEPPEAARAAGLETYDPRHRRYQRYGATLGRSWIASPRLVGRVEGAWMDGVDLDRFSRYAFGTFDNRLRGYPAALVRYDRGGVVRSVAAWSAGRLIRLDGFADTAYVRDPGFGSRSRRYTGIGAAIEAPGPFGTLLGVEWGYGFQGVNTDSTRGTQVLRVSGYKMF